MLRTEVDRWVASADARAKLHRVRALPLSCRARRFPRAVSADPIARTAYDRLLDGRKREHVRAIKSAIKPDTRIRRIEKALATLRELESAGSAADHGRTRPL
jgi:hypothetical protein